MCRRRRVCVCVFVTRVRKFASAFCKTQTRRRERRVCVFAPETSAFSRLHFIVASAFLFYTCSAHKPLKTHFDTPPPALTARWIHYSTPTVYHRFLHPSTQQYQPHFLANQGNLDWLLLSWIDLLQVFFVLIVPLTTAHSWASSTMSNTVLYAVIIYSSFLKTHRRCFGQHF